MFQFFLGALIGAFVTMTVPAVYEPLGLERVQSLHHLDLKADAHADRLTRRELERLYVGTKGKLDSCRTARDAYNRGRSEILDTTKAVIEK
jgi:hypothetical protein